MGKRTPGQFDRRDRDCYDTPYPAVLFLLPFLTPGTTFYEPCAGDGTLIQHLIKHGFTCVGASDVAPRHSNIAKLDGLDLTRAHLLGADCLITNPPFSRKIMHLLIEHFRVMAPTWLLLELDWTATEQAVPFMRHCSDIVAIGRLKLIHGSPHSGYDNFVWAKFQAEAAVTQFHPRRRLMAA